MKIALIQYQPAKGDVQTNIKKHVEWARQAADEGADLVIFPELSLTGYEPTFAASLATDITDPGFRELQICSDDYRITICAGMPIRQEDGVSISLLIFQPEKEIALYSKTYLHADEQPWFVPSMNLAPLSIHDKTIAFSICFELSIPQHSENAVQSGATLYLSSSAKTAKGVEEAHHRLASIASQYAIHVLFVNSVGPSDDFIGAGASAAWDMEGKLIKSLDAHQEDMLLIDTRRRN